MAETSKARTDPALVWRVCVLFRRVTLAVHTLQGCWRTKGRQKKNFQGSFRKGPEDNSVARTLTHDKRWHRARRRLFALGTWTALSQADGCGSRQLAARARAPVLGFWPRRRYRRSGLRLWRLASGAANWRTKCFFAIEDGRHALARQSWVTRLLSVFSSHDQVGQQQWQRSSAHRRGRTVSPSSSGRSSAYFAAGADCRH